MAPKNFHTYLESFSLNGINNLSDKTAIVDTNGVEYSFKQLQNISNAFANILKNKIQTIANKNPNNDIVIGICLPQSAEIIFSLFAILKIGAAYLPFEMDLPEARIRHMITESRPVLIITSDATQVFDNVLDMVEILDAKEIFEELKSKGNVETNVNCNLQVSTQETFLVQYTSGSSGVPKGVRLGRQALLNRLSWQYKEFPFVQEDMCVLKTSLTFVDSVAEIFAPLMAGYPIVIFPKSVTTSPLKFVESLVKFGVSRLVLVPSLLRAILGVLDIHSDKEWDSLKVRLWVCSGEILPKALLLDFFKHFPKECTICNFYGSTEVMGDVTFISFKNIKEAISHCDEKYVTIGSPVDNTKIYLLNSDLEEVSVIGQTGEICVGGVCLALGYVGVDPSKCQKFVKYPKRNEIIFKTGDYGYFSLDIGTNEKLLWFSGRLDAQLKIRGQRVNLLEIQIVISKIEGISQVIVLSPNPGEESPEIVAFLKLAEENGAKNMLRIETVINQCLKKCEQPKLVIVEEMPLLINGKIDRQMLLQKYAKQGRNDKFTDKQVNQLLDTTLIRTQTCISILSELLNLPVQTVWENLHKSFFDLGGNSLNSITAVLRLRNNKCYITVEKFIVAESIQEVIEALADNPERVERFESNVPQDYCPARGEVGDLGEYKVDTIRHEDFAAVSRMIATSFTKKNALTICSKATYTDTIDYVSSFWNEAVEKGLSILIRNSVTGEPIGCSINFDAYDHPSGNSSKSNAYIFELIDSLESKEMEKLPSGKGKLFRSGLMATDEKLCESDNIKVVYLMEERVLQIAKDKGFLASFTSNSSPLTLQITTNLLNYQVLSTLEPQKFVSVDGSRPFANMEKGTVVACCLKMLG